MKHSEKDSLGMRILCAVILGGLAAAALAWVVEIIIAIVMVVLQIIELMGGMA